MFSFNFNNKYFFYTKVNHIVEVWQKTTKFCKATILQLKNKLIKCTHVQEGLDMYKRNPENHISSAMRKHSFILIFCCPLMIETVGRSFCFRGEPLAQSLGHFCTRRQTGSQAFMWQTLNSMRGTESGGAVRKTKTTQRWVCLRSLQGSVGVCGLGAMRRAGYERKTTACAPFVYQVWGGPQEPLVLLRKSSQVITVAATSLGLRVCLATSMERSNAEVFGE